jgi:hypothetical protein
MYLQPFANEAWFLRYTQEVAAVVDGYRQRAAERRTPVSSFFQPRASPAVSTIRSSAAGLGLRGPAAPSSSRLSSAAVSPVPSSLPAGSPAAVSPVAASPSAPSPSLLPLRQVQPAPSNSPAAVATTVPPSAPRTSVVVEAAAPVASSGSRRAHFEDLDAAEGEDEELPWIRVSRLIVFEVACYRRDLVRPVCRSQGRVSSARGRPSLPCVRCLLQAWRLVFAGVRPLSQALCPGARPSACAPRPASGSRSSRFSYSSRRSRPFRGRRVRTVLGPSLGLSWPRLRHTCRRALLFSWSRVG